MCCLLHETCHCSPNQSWGSGGSSHHRGQQMKAVRVPTAPPALHGQRGWGQVALGSPGPAHCSERHAGFFCHCLWVRKEQFSLCPGHKNTCMFYQVLSSILQSQMQLPISEIPYRSRMRVTSTASQGILQGKHNFKAMFCSLILHILSSDAG